MTNAASPIQVPSPSVLGELLLLIQTGSVKSGLVLSFDRERHVFLTAVVDQGVVIKWQLESCCGDVEAQALRDSAQELILAAQARLVVPAAGAPGIVADVRTA